MAIKDPSRSVLGACLLILALLLSACGGPEAAGAGAGKNGPPYGKVIRVQGGSYRAISPEELSEIWQEQDPFVVNVHIPYEGEIEPTDAFIPFSEIEKHLDELPANKSATIVLYCRSGVMSADASRVLSGLGYTGIYDLKGGMAAWKASGRQVVVKPR